MPDCDYCSASFADESAYLSHLAADHRDELGRIDERRVVDHLGGPDDGAGPPYALYGLGIAFVLIVVGLLGLVLTMGSSDGDIHEHGDITLEIDGEVYDFDRPPYHTISGDFHFHAGQGNYWHMHPTPSERLTLGEAMAELDVPMTDTSIEVDGRLYDDEDPDVDVEFSVDGDPVDSDYELHDGDHIEIVVETDG